MKFSCVFLAGVALLCLAGCSSGSETGEADAQREGLTHFALDAAPGPETAALVMANRQGFFREAGISVTLGQPFSLPNAVSYLDGGGVDLIVAPVAQAILGSSVVAIRSVVQAPTEALIWLDGSGIDAVADLKGKTIAIPGFGFQEKFLGIVLSRAGLKLADVKVRSLPYTSVAALATGRVDAIFGGSWNVEGTELRARGLRPEITRLQNLGIPPFEQAVLLANSYRLPSKESLDRFMAALDRGTAAAIEHPVATARAIAAERSEPEKNAVKWLAGLKATLPLLSRSGNMSLGWAERLNSWMYDHGLFEIKVPAKEAFTDRYLEASDES